MLILSTISGCRRADPIEQFKTYLHYWSQKNYEGMYSILSSAAKSKIDKETFVNRYHNIFSSIKLKKIDITRGELSIEDDNSYLPVEIKFSTDTVGTFECSYIIPLIYEEKQWKVEWEPSLIFPMLVEGDEVYITRQLPERGFILDRYGEPLAHKGPGYEVVAVPGKIPDEEKFAKNLAPLLEVSEEYILKELNQEWVQPDYRVPLRNFPFNISQDFKDKLLSIKGVLLSTIKTRQYPYESIFSHITGYIAPITAEQLEEKAEKDYNSEDLIGQMGMELAMEEELRGNPGYTLFVRDSQGEYKTTIAQSSPQDGSDVILTVDASLQSIIFDEMGNKKGTIIAINPNSGEILGMVSKPSYDPNLFPSKISTSMWKKLSENEDNPFINRALRALYPPGSTIKPFIATIGLEEEIITPETTVEEAKNIKWQPFPEWGDYFIKRVSHPEGDVNLDRALIWSNNIYFAWLALEIGGETLEKYLKGFGFGEDISFLIYTETSQVKNNSSDWTSILLANTGYGQGEMLITPLQLATMFTCFANNGEIMQPSLIRENIDNKGQRTESFSPVIWKEQAISQSSLDIILPSLVNVIEDPTGTGYPARTLGLKTAGKTGTSQLGNQEEIRWFIVFTIDEKNPLLLCVALEVNEEEDNSKFSIASEILTDYYEK